MNRRVVMLGIVAVLASCARESGDATDRALGWLWAQQGPDGLLQADTYGVLRRGESVTAAALFATALLSESRRADCSAAVARAFAGLSAPARRDEPVDYPAYTAACHLHALCLLRPSGWQEQVDRRLGQLRTWQLSSDNGWLADDPAYGGFGLGNEVPRKPLGADLVTLSCTVTVLEAVRAAGLPSDDPLVGAARCFVERCQHFAAGALGDVARGDSEGGFFAAPTDEWRGGKAGRDDTGRKRAYGTATADGLRALLACGAGLDHVRVVAAARWLRRHRGELVPGLLEEFEPALRCYWAATRARTFAVLGEPVPPPPWLLSRQRADGAFVGFSAAMKEDEPVVATVLALLALAAGR